MAYIAVALVALLIGALSAVYFTRKPINPTDQGLDSLQQSHQREHEADAEAAKTADPVIYLRDALAKLRR